jgi:Spy/CpxP family protein refolding chaperone
MTRILLAALTSGALAAAAIAVPALAADIHQGPARTHKPVVMNRAAPHHHPIHCTIRHHHRICR